VHAPVGLHSTHADHEKQTKKFVTTTVWSPKQQVWFIKVRSSQSARADSYAV